MDSEATTKRVAKAFRGVAFVGSMFVGMATAISVTTGGPIVLGFLQTPEQQIEPTVTLDSVAPTVSVPGQVQITD